jgi:hypothetical protein
LSGTKLSLDIITQYGIWIVYVSLDGVSDKAVVAAYLVRPEEAAGAG